jgi:NADPH:quinone reductase-like Zn-dependent oxidoreductase
VHAAAVNPTDTLVRDGSRAATQKEFAPPYVPGMDAAGVLDEIGDGVATDLAIGDHVMAIVAAARTVRTPSTSSCPPIRWCGRRRATSSRRRHCR